MLWFEAFYSFLFRLCFGFWLVIFKAVSFNFVNFVNIITLDSDSTFFFCCVWVWVYKPLCFKFEELAIFAKETPWFTWFAGFCCFFLGVSFSLLHFYKWCTLSNLRCVIHHSLRVSPLISYTLGNLVKCILHYIWHTWVFYNSSFD